MVGSKAKTPLQKGVVEESYSSHTVKKQRDKGGARKENVLFQVMTPAVHFL